LLVGFQARGGKRSRENLGEGTIVEEVSVLKEERKRETKLRNIES